MARWVRAGSVAGGVLVAAAALASCHGGPHLQLVVTSTADAVDIDPGDGVCEATVGVGDCSLRAAVMEVNAAPAGTAASIELAPGSTHVLELAGAEDLGVTGDLDVVRPGDVVDVIGNGAVVQVSVDAGQGIRHLEVHAGRVRLHDLVLEDGTTSYVGLSGGDGPSGGAIANHAELELHDVELSGNGADAGGAAVHQTGGSLVVRRSRVVGNLGLPLGGPWAAIHIEDGSLVVLDSEISDNLGTCVTLSACSSSDYGGIRQAGGTGTIISSTVAGHYWDRFNGFGFDVFPGFGIDVEGSVEVVRSTVVDNGADLDLVGAGSVDLGGSVAEACTLTGTVTSGGYNRDEDGSCHASGEVTDLIDAGAVLESLDFNGGPTRSMVPVAASGLVDAIPTSTPTLCDGTIAADQRGEPSSSGAGCDRGAVERQPSDP